MSEEKENSETESNKEEVRRERDELNKMGLNSTWDVLSEKKEKKEEEKKEFRGFK